MSACRIEETDLPGYYYCREHRVEMSQSDYRCPLAEAQWAAENWKATATDHLNQLTDVRHRNRVLTESLAAHADEITALRAELASLVERLLGAP